MLRWYRDHGQGGGPGACVDGSRARRRNGDGEGGEDRGEKLHGSNGVNEWRESMRDDESRYLFGEERGGLKRNVMRRKKL